MTAHTHTHFVNTNFLTYFLINICSWKRKGGIHLFHEQCFFLLYPLFSDWFRLRPSVLWLCCHHERVGCLGDKSPGMLGDDLSVFHFHLSISRSLFPLFFPQVSLWLRSPPPTAYLPTIHRRRLLPRARTPPPVCVVRSDYRPLHCPRQVGPRHWPAGRG